MKIQFHLSRVAAPFKLPPFSLPLTCFTASNQLHSFPFLPFPLWKPLHFPFNQGVFHGYLQHKQECYVGSRNGRSEVYYD